MELLSYPSLEATEEQIIQNFLANLLVLKLDERVEQEAIAFRRASGVKLPDAIIAATARVHGLDLLTLDRQLHTKFTAYITDG
jgi:predicted nucleic acid-binding protein